MNSWRTVRVFISSTFRDMQAERDHLVRFVFPRLREELLPRRIHLVDVDLRWGVTSDQDALGVCREVIDECRPRFMGILGGRYGWVPEGRTESITADEVHYAVLNREAEKRGHAFFYFRDEHATASMVEEMPGDFREPEHSENARKLAALKQAITDAGLPVFTYPAQWDAAQKRLIGLEKFGERVHDDLLQSLKDDSELAARFTSDGTSPPDEFAEEVDQMDAFIEERADHFVLGSREPLMRKVLDFTAAEGAPNIFVLTGEPGSGKSAFLAKFCRLLTHGSPNLQVSPSPSLLIPHFIGASTGSTDLRRTLRRLCHELARAAANNEPLPLDIKELITHFQKLLAEAGAKKRVVIVFDALNQIDTTDGAHWLNWLPRELPPGVRIVASVIAPTDGQPEHQTLAILRTRPATRMEKLEPLTEADTLAIIEGCLRRYAKRLSPEQLAALLAKPAGRLPLYVLTALEELRTLGTYEEITERIRTLPGDARALFGWILTERLANDPIFGKSDGEPRGRKLVEKFAACLGVSRHGLSPAELTALLDPGDPLGNVAALLRLLRPYLMRRGELLDFYHGQFREAAEAAHLDTPEKQRSARRHIADYFHPQSNWAGIWAGLQNRLPNHRKMDELLFQLLLLEDRQGIESCIGSFEFVEAKCRAALVDDLRLECNQASEHWGWSLARQVGDCIAAAQPSMLLHPQWTLQSICNGFATQPNLEPQLAAEMSHAQKECDNRGAWVSLRGTTWKGRDQAKRRLSFIFPSSVQHCVPSRNWLCCVAPDTSGLQIYDIGSGEVKAHRTLHSKERIAAATVDAASGQAAWITVDGLAQVECSGKSVPCRKGDKAIGFASSFALLLVLDDNRLVVWSWGEDRIDVLAYDLPRPAHVRTSPDGRRLLLIAGNKDSWLGIVEQGTSGWVLHKLPWQGIAARCAALREKADPVLIGCRDRSLHLVDASTGRCVQSVHYESQSGSRVFGPLSACAFSSSVEANGIFFTTERHLAAWDPLTGTLDLVCEYRRALDPSELITLETFSGEALPFLAFNDRGFFAQQTSADEPKIYHSGEVSQCALSLPGMAISLGGQDSTVRCWSLPSLAPSDTRVVPAARLLAFTPRDDCHISVADQDGLLHSLPIGACEVSTNIVMLGESAPCALLILDETHIVAGFESGRILMVTLLGSLRQQIDPLLLPRAASVPKALFSLKDMECILVVRQILGGEILKRGERVEVSCLNTRKTWKLLWASSSLEHFRDACYCAVSGVLGILTSHHLHIFSVSACGLKKTASMPGSYSALSRIAVLDRGRHLVLTGHRDNVTAADLFEVTPSMEHRATLNLDRTITALHTGADGTILFGTSSGDLALAALRSMRGESIEKPNRRPTPLDRISTWWARLTP